MFALLCLFPTLYFFPEGYLAYQSPLLLSVPLICLSQIKNRCVSGNGSENFR